jgi:anti-sigma regulatory factor (Ser/Thr protein kinase)
MEGSGVLMIEKGNLQEGMKFQLRSKSILDSLGIHSAFTYLNLAETFFKLKRYNNTLALIDSARILVGREKDPYEVRQLWYGIADIFKKMGDYKKANIALDSAYSSYATERDSSLLKYGRELEAKYAAREKDQRIITLALKNKVSLQVQNQQRLIIISLIIASLAMLLAAILFWRRRKLQQMLRESHLQQRVLQVQLQPHFLGNLLSILKGHIRTGNQERSIALINQFGLVAEYNLQNAELQLVTLAAELKAVENFLYLQSLLIEDVFVFTIDVSEDCDTEDFLIPPMLIQPFVENAVNHGVKRLNRLGFIKIKIEIEDQMLRCTIKDNGHGMATEQSKRSDRMHAITIAAERIELLKAQTGLPASLTITDNRKQGEEGVSVSLTIPWKYNIYSNQEKIHVSEHM